MDASSSRQIAIPPDVTSLAAAVIAVWNEGEMDVDDLERAIALAILAGRTGSGGALAVLAEAQRQRRLERQRERYRERKEADPEWVRRKDAGYRERLKDDPDRKARVQSSANERNRRLRNESIEKYREYARRRLIEKPIVVTEEFAARKRESYRRWAKKNPEAATLKSARRWRRDKARRAGPAIVAAADAAVAKTYPKHIRDDIIAAVVANVMAGNVEIGDIPAEAKRQATAYWRERPEYRQQSMDAQRFDDGRATLHDTVTRGLWDD